MSSESVLGVRCKCGGRLKKGTSEVEFFGIDFGVRPAEICTICGSEYISQEALSEIEGEVRRKGLFGLERKGKVAKSGNSLVVRIPQEIVKSLKIARDVPVTIYPAEKKKIIIEIEG